MAVASWSERDEHETHYHGVSKMLLKKGWLKQIFKFMMGFFQFFFPEIFGEEKCNLGGVQAQKV